MLKDTQCFSGVISSYFADHAGITIKIPNHEDRVFLLGRQSKEQDNGILGSHHNQAASFSAVRQGLTVSVFMEQGDPRTADILKISPNYS